MTTPDLTPILNDLAAGRIDAIEAARRIEQLKNAAGMVSPADAAAAGGAGEATAEQPSSPSREESRDRDGWEGGRPQTPGHARESFFDPEPEPIDEVPQAERRKPFDGKGVDRIQVRAVGRRVRIVGDYSVTAVAAEGPHVLRRNGTVLEVSSDGEIGPSLDGFSMLRPPRSFDDIRAMSLGKELYLRVNPSITVDVELTAGSLATEKLPYLGKIRVTAGGATCAGVAEANDVLVQAGNLNLSGSFRTGRSRVRCESGALNVALDEDSNVTVKADANLGRINWVGQEQAMDEVVMGNGAARLDVGVVMGYASIKLGRAEER